MTAAAREQVWLALSELYLDTDVEPSIEPCATVLAESPYSREELQRILFEEVHPLLVFNLLSVAGQWGGFDSDWLAAAIRRQQAHWNIRAWLGRRLLRSVPRKLWPRLDEIIVRLRSARTAS
jgi:hypothetical protein